MNDLGLTMAWCAVRASLMLVPAAVLHSLASRRSPASGAWVASLSLGLVVAISLLTFIPRGGESFPTTPNAEPAAPAPAPAADRGTAPPSVPRSFEAGKVGWSIAAFRGFRERLETGAAVPAARFRPWGRTLAVATLAGIGASLLHLIVGLWGVHRCLRRSRPVDDPGLNHLIREFQAALGCRRRVEIRETAELTTPATAGWWRVAVLLPDDWRSWDEHERRAVLAHELAHVRRNDYATGIVARVALTLHFYHPLVHRLATRLQWEQELAADALGARFAGDRTRYLQSLSRLALRQDGRTPCGPARAFLPAKGILIRRITMLRDESSSNDRPWSVPRLGASALLLLAVFGGVLSLRGPARGDDAAKADDEVKAATRESRADDKPRDEPFDLTYLPDDAPGFLAFRPAATFRREGMGMYRPMLNLRIAQQWSEAANSFEFDPAQPGQGPLRIEMFEQVMCTFDVDRSDLEEAPRRIKVGGVISARTAYPVDWVRLARAFKLDPTEVREGNRTYYKFKHPSPFGPDGCMYCPDDRTLVIAPEKQLLPLLSRTTPARPVFANGKDWDGFLRGLLVLALDNRDGRLAKVFKKDEAEAVEVAPLFEHADSWAFGFGPGDEIVFNAAATCPQAGGSESTARAGRTILKAIRREISELPPSDPASKDVERARRMLVDLATNCRVECEGRSVVLRSSGLGTIADFASLVAAEMKE